MPKSLKHYLVTGGAGFIGSHLADYLLAKGDEVYVLDDLSTGSIRNLEAARRSPRFHYVIGSVLNQPLLAELIDTVDSVYHLAASVGVKLIVERLVESIENNVKGTEYVLQMASKKGRKVLLTSTSEVYGRGRKEIFSETDDLMMGPTTKSRWSYACSKALDEYLAFAYHQEKGVPVTVARLFNTVGERQTDAYGMVLPTFVKQAIAGHPLTIHGDGAQSRCFCHVSDVVAALVNLMEHPAANGEVYNIGSTESVTMSELADRVISLTRSPSEKKYIPYKDAYPAGFEDISRRIPDISKIHTLIGFTPSHSLNQIIERLHRRLQSPATLIPSPFLGRR